MKYKQIKKKNLPLLFFLFADKRKKCLKKTEKFLVQFFLASIFAKNTKNLVFIWTLDIYHLLILTISWY